MVPKDDNASIYVGFYAYITWFFFERIENYLSDFIKNKVCIILGKKSC